MIPIEYLDGGPARTEAAPAAEPAAPAVEAGAVPPPEPPAPAIPLAEHEAALAAERERTLRMAADFDNFRKRTEANRREMAMEEKGFLLADLFEGLDNLRRAAEQFGPETDEGKGVAAIGRQFEDVLRKHGAEPIPAEGVPFNPRFHEALDLAPDPALPSGLVRKTYKSGWMFQGKVLRPALVQVVQNEPDQAPEAAPANMDVEA